ncbi:hypothetical protein CPC08DRAFT_479571 [Agrocybe pediades]|nr:hypothetical protein CPC08DRAFT_479571 [Agrocybe pediades]
MDAEMAGVAPATVATTVHSQFGPGNGTDLVIQSSDGVLFHVNRSNLDRCAEAFPGSDATGITSESKDVVHLTETAAVLEILFQFGYPTRHPVLDNLEFKKLLAVADAAEKYHFYSAAPMCQIVLRSVPFPDILRFLLSKLERDFLFYLLVMLGTTSQSIP